MQPSVRVRRRVTRRIRRTTTAAGMIRMRVLTRLPRYTRCWGGDFSGGEQVKLSSYIPKAGTLPTNLEIYYMSEQGGFLHIVIMDIGGYPCVSITDIAGNDLFMSIKQPEKRRDDFLFAGEDEYKYKTLSISKDWSSVTLGDKTYEMVMTADEVQGMLKLLGQ